MEHDETERGQLAGRLLQKPPADSLTLTIRQHVQGIDPGGRARRVVLGLRTQHQTDGIAGVVFSDQQNDPCVLALSSLGEQPCPCPRRHVRCPLVHTFLPGRVGHLAAVRREPRLHHHAPHGQCIVDHRCPDLHHSPILAPELGTSPSVWS